MQRTRRFILPNAVLLAAFISGGCDMDPVPLPDAKKDYAGAWAGEDMTLVITPGGRVDYRRGSTSIDAPIQGFDGDDFKVGALGLSTTFDVQEPPHQADDGRWQMKVDGVDLVRVEAE